MNINASHRPSITGADVVAEARSWVGTPFHHQARLKGHGVDCIGLLVGVARALGFGCEDSADYARFPDGRVLLDEMRRQFVEIAPDAMQPGDMLVFAMSRLPRHAAIYMGEVNGQQRMAHATSMVGKCVEVGIDRPWQRALVAVFRFPEVC